MTTAHRATYKPARGATASAGRALVRSAAVSGRDGVNHTVLKKRERLPLGASLGSDGEYDDIGGGGGDAATGAIGGLVDVGSGTGAGAPLRRRKRRAPLLAATRAEEVAAAAVRYAEADADVTFSDSSDEGEEGGGGRRRRRHQGGVAVSEAGSGTLAKPPGEEGDGGCGRARGDGDDPQLRDGQGAASGGDDKEASDSDDNNDDDEDDDEDDDDAELLRELELIKAERAAERARAQADADGDGGGNDDCGGLATGGLLGDNPLLSDAAAESDAGTTTTAFRVQRRWDDDLVFRHQTRGQVVPAKRFINDTVRNDFHRRFLDKYIR